MGLLDALKEQWQAGEPARAALGGLLYGDTAPAKEFLGTGKQWPRMTPEVMNAIKKDAYDMALGWNNPIAGSGLLAHTVWHGSPHKFDKFDISKIGTGEGAQAYGHGLYLAENPDVASGYANKLSTVSSDGGYSKIPRVATYGNTVPRRVDMNAPSNTLSPAELALTYVNMEGGKANASLALMDMASDPYVYGTDKYKKALQALQRMDAKKIGAEYGNLYKVDIPDSAIPKMLDWDKPVSQQHPETLKMLRKSFDDIFSKQRAEGNWNAAQGIEMSELMNWLSGHGPASGDIAKRTTETLKNNGIPGIRYLDGNSRGAGQGSYNYVIFDDSLPKILERNGKPLGLLE